MMSNEKYNGWTNYATWKIMLEIFDGFEPPLKDEEISSQFCEEYVYEWLEMDNTLAFFFLVLFLVNNHFSMIHIIIYPFFSKKI